MPEIDEQKLTKQLLNLPQQIDEVLAIESIINELSNSFASKHHVPFLGLRAKYPVAMEGALKLKDISYIHVEAYASGELKHGSLALVDEDMSVLTVAASDSLLEKLKSNHQEVKACGGKLINIASNQAELDNNNMVSIQLPKIDDLTAPIVFSVPLQLLAYHVALVKGTDVDKPGNLAKSVSLNKIEILSNGCC